MPQNIFIVARDEANMRVIIGEFGTAKTTIGGTSMFTLTAYVGYRSYLAPEILSALSQNLSEAFGLQYNKKSDIFSAAIVSYHTLSLGEHSFGRHWQYRKMSKQE